MATPFAGVHAAAVQRVGRKLHHLEVQAAAINQLAIASVAYRQERLALSRTIRWSIGYGIPLAEIVATTGLPEALVHELLEEVD